MYVPVLISCCLRRTFDPQGGGNLRGLTHMYHSGSRCWRSDRAPIALMAIGNLGIALTIGIHGDDISSAGLSNRHELATALMLMAEALQV